MSYSSSTSGNVTLGKSKKTNKLRKKHGKQGTRRGKAKRSK